MNNLPGNPHYDVSEKMIAAADEMPMPDSEDQASVATLASVQQSLQAIAFEQRTANLIAVATTLFPAAIGDEMQPDIAARLGLEGAF